MALMHRGSFWSAARPYNLFSRGVTSIQEMPSLASLSPCSTALLFSVSRSLFPANISEQFQEQGLGMRSLHASISLVDSASTLALVKEHRKRIAREKLSNQQWHSSKLKDQSRTFAIAAAAQGKIDKPHVAVVGAGMVGLATAREFLLQYPTAKVIVVEKEKDIVPHQTSHNSGVIHAGLYYPTGSRMARLCVQGNRLMYEYCKEKGIKHERVGKLVVATTDWEVRELDGLLARAAANKVPDCRLIDTKEIEEMEPNVRALKALYSPSTGIVDYGDVGRQIAKDVLATGRAEIRTGFEVCKIEPRGDSVLLESKAGDRVQADYVITAAGLQADRVAQLGDGAKTPKIVPFRGTYHELKPEYRNIVKRNIYPVSNEKLHSVGVHITPRVDGRVLIGPNAALALSREGYRFSDVSVRDIWDYAKYAGLYRMVFRNLRVTLEELYKDVSARAFVRAAQRYCPSLRLHMTRPAFSGVHALALAPSGDIVQDFVYELSPRNADRKRILHVRNAPSPACTAGLAIAKDVVGEAASHLGWSSSTFREAI